MSPHYAELTRFDEHTIDRLVQGSRQHARRRTDEMAAAAEQLRELGVSAFMATATEEVLKGLIA